MPSYLWYPVPLSEAVNQQFFTLSLSEQKAVFAKLNELYRSENPYYAPQVKKLSEQRFEGSRRVRVGKYRIIFRLNVGEIIRYQHNYKGELIIESIDLRRDAYD